eukprot:7430280-Alexandrium_andersonii.AAC.1
MTHAQTQTQTQTQTQRSGGTERLTTQTYTGTESQRRRGTEHTATGRHRQTQARNTVSVATHIHDKQVLLMTQGCCAALRYNAPRLLGLSLGLDQAHGFLVGQDELEQEEQLGV